MRPFSFCLWTCRNIWWWTCTQLRTARCYWTVSTVTERSSTSRLLQWQTRRKDVKPLEPCPHLIKMRLHTSRTKTSVTTSAIASLLADKTGQLPFSVVSKDLEAELHSSCLLNSTVTSFHSFPRLPSLPSHFPSCYCLLSATPALAVSPHFLSTVEPTGLWSTSRSPLSLEGFRSYKPSFWHAVELVSGLVLTDTSS